MKWNLILSCILISNLVDAQIKYPETRKTDVKENYFGTEVADPYRWLEIDTAAEVEKWVSDQNDVTRAFLYNISYRAGIYNRLSEIWDYPKFSAPFTEGPRMYYSYNDGLKNQSVVYVKQKPEDEWKVFIDPNTLSSDGTVSLGGLFFSTDHNLCAYLVSASGSDWQELYIKDAATGKLLPDHLKWIKFTNIAWYKNGFYYSRYPEPAKGTEYSTASSNPKIYYHKLGTTQAEDVLVYEDPEHPKRYIYPILTEDEKYMFIGLSEGTSGNGYLIGEPKAGQGEQFKSFIPGFKNNHGIIGNIGNQIYVRTDLGADNYRVVAIDPAKPESANWKTLISSKDALLQGASLVQNKFYVTYLKDVTHRVMKVSLDGKTSEEISLPGLGSISGFGGEQDDTVLYFSFSNFVQAPSVYSYHVKDGTVRLYRKSEFSVSMDDYVTKQVFYPSKDGTKIPMFIMHKKGIELTGNNPTLLYAYGGFNISLTPSFSPSNIVFLENGGVYCVANLRGGGEYGESWHKAGMLQNKQNVFDDFIAAAEYLIANKYTSPDRLAISGRSNGGLLVGACMTQRPELFKVALPGVGVMDMLRYHKFTVGWGWAVEYGSSENEKDFKNLYAYSPLHNLRKGVKYPSTLITTADHDDRVVPAHSFKFAATLQECHAGKNPVLIRIDTKAGHGAGKPITKVIEEQADVWTFVFDQLGMSMDQD